jgi:hypothetical protein
MGEIAEFAAKLHWFKDLCGPLRNLRVLCGFAFFCRYNGGRLQTGVFLRNDGIKETSTAFLKLGNRINCTDYTSH